MSVEELERKLCKRFRNGIYEDEQNYGLVSTSKVRAGSVEMIGVSLRSTSNMSVLIEVHWQPLLGVYGSK
jgi:hypothetical protein